MESSAVFNTIAGFAAGTTFFTTGLAAVAVLGATGLVAVLV